MYSSAILLQRNTKLYFQRCRYIYEKKQTKNTSIHTKSEKGDNVTRLLLDNYKGIFNYITRKLERDHIEAFWTNTEEFIKILGYYERYD